MNRNTHNVVELMNRLVASTHKMKLLLHICSIWDEISGNLSAYTMPVEIRFFARNNISLTVSVVVSACTLFSYAKSSIIEKIKLLFNLHEVRLYIRKVAYIDVIRKKNSNRCNADIMHHNHNTVENKCLRSALDELYSLILTKNN